MATWARLIGGAGTGKTTELLGLMQQVIAAGVGGDQIGFCSFTVAARAEAAGRAAAILGCRPTDLTQRGWYRTIHSIAYQCVGAEKKQMIADDAAGAAWMEKSLGEKITPLDGELDDTKPEAASGAAVALAVWDVARNRLEPFAAAWHRLQSRGGIGNGSWGFEASLKFVIRYEEAKRADGMMDFTDLLGAFAGWAWEPAGEPNGFAEPRGYCPNLKVWFLDEAQDVTPLSWSCFQRLTKQPAVQWVYLSGDPFQAIYDWAGADHHILLNAECEKTKTMPRSYRCPPAVLAAGERCIAACADYFPRGIAPRDGGDAGFVAEDNMNGVDDILGAANERGYSVLLLARCNFQLTGYAAKLNESGIPWMPTRGAGGWNRPVQFRAFAALHRLELGGVVFGAQWPDVMEVLATCGDHEPGLRRGIKTKFDEGKFAGMNLPLAELGQWGATDPLLTAVAAGTWPALLKDRYREWASRYRDGVNRHGQEVVDAPRVRCGTIHSVKGAEADIVCISSGGTKNITQAGADDQEAADAERRLAYVAHTRARVGTYVLRDYAAARRRIEHEWILDGLPQ